MKHLLRTTVISTVLFLAAVASFLNSERAVADESNRMDHQFGFYTSILGDPYTSLVGLNFAYNPVDFLRFNAGYGLSPVTRTYSSYSYNYYSSSYGGTTSENQFAIGTGLKALVPGWSFSPVVGLNWAMLVYTPSGTRASISGLDGFTDSGHNVYTNIGFDWQASTGFTIGSGVNVSFLANVAVLPYLNIGWMF